MPSEALSRAAKKERGPWGVAPETPCQRAIRAREVAAQFAKESYAGASLNATSVLIRSPRVVDAGTPWAHASVPADRPSRDERAVASLG